MRRRWIGFAGICGGERGWLLPRLRRQFLRLIRIVLRIALVSVVAGRLGIPVVEHRPQHRNAILLKALTDGKKHFVAVAVVARCDGGPMPCGACRQLLAEYAPDAKVFVADSDDLKTIQAFTVRRLLPAAFVLVP